MTQDRVAQPSLAQLIADVERRQQELAATKQDHDTAQRAMWRAESNLINAQNAFGKALQEAMLVAGDYRLVGVRETYIPEQEVAHHG